MLRESVPEKKYLKLVSSASEKVGKPVWLPIASISGTAMHLATVKDEGAPVARQDASREGAKVSPTFIA